MYVIIDTEGENRVQGYSMLKTSTSNPRFDIVETVKETLSGVFQDAADSGHSLAGADAMIEEAVEEPLPFCDYLVLEDDEISFDKSYERSDTV